MCSPEYTPHLHTIHGHLFQATMWREFAACWTETPNLRWTDSKAGVMKLIPTYFDRDWVEHILKVSRDECVRRARIHLAAARAKNHE